MVYSTSQAIYDSAYNVCHLNWTKCSAILRFLPFGLGALNNELFLVFYKQLRREKHSKNITEDLLAFVETFTLKFKDNWLLTRFQSCKKVSKNTEQIYEVLINYILSSHLTIQCYIENNQISRVSLKIVSGWFLFLLLEVFFVSSTGYNHGYCLGISNFGITRKIKVINELKHGLNISTCGIKSNSQTYTTSSHIINWISKVD